ncbi:MAG: choice-of-anchor D domain-containing protein [Acidimicrobiales bacterium]
MYEGREMVVRSVKCVAVIAALLALVGFSVGGVAAATTPVSGGAAASSVSVRVVGNQLVNAAGQPVRLLGVDRSGTEYACIQGWGIFDGPSNAASVAAMAAWHVDAVRVPLNEDCWLGINGVNPAYGGANYRAAIESYVQLLHSFGIVVILDLHWNAPGAIQATGQQVMADASHSPAFWSSVASTFKLTPGVVFDLYNEPHDISWPCWLNGCTTSGGWQAAGMQSLVNAVRSTGATQPIMVAGLNWAGDLSQWLANEPVDPLHQLVASVHIYNFSQCNTASCWAQTIAPVAAKVPVVTGELGENDCSTSFVDSYMAWADGAGVSYLGWAWDAGGGWTCSGGPSLITDYQGNPTAYGAGLKNHLAALYSSGAMGGSGGSGSTPAVALSSTSLAFGSEAVGTQTAPKVVTISNVGTAPLTVSGVTVSGASFASFTVGLDTCTSGPVAPGSSCSVDVSFLPSGAGASSATLQLADDAAGSPQSVTMSGMGTVPAPPSSGQVGLTYAVVNQWSGGLQAKLTIANGTTAALGTQASPWVFQFQLPSTTSIGNLWDGILSASPSGGTTTYTVTGPSWQSTISAGTSWTIGYTASGPGATPANCTIDEVACTVTSPGGSRGGGTGGPGGTPAASVSPASIAFGPQTVGTSSSPHILTVKNTGTAALAVTEVTASGPGSSSFAIGADSCTKTPVAMGASCTVSVSFLPTAAGTLSATLKVADNAAGNSQGVPMSGTGMTPTPPPPPPGNVASLTYTVVNRWSGGLQARLTVKNSSSTGLGTAASPWVVDFTLPTSMTVTSLWNGVMKKVASGGRMTYSIKGPSWHPIIRAGTSWTIGYVANGPGAPPSNCTIDGRTCPVHQ